MKWRLSRWRANALFLQLLLMLLRDAAAAEQRGQREMRTLSKPTGGLQLRPRMGARAWR
jgi:hypothetical protein